MSHFLVDLLILSRVRCFSVCLAVLLKHNNNNVELRINYTIV